MERLRQMYDLFEAEANACLERRPGAAGARLRAEVLAHLQRAGYARRGRRHRAPGASSAACATSPAGWRRLIWSSASGWNIPGWIKSGGQSGKRIGLSSHTTAIPTSYPLSPAPFLLEIGTEELPAGDLDPALEQLRERCSGVAGRAAPGAWRGAHPGHAAPPGGPGGGPGAAPDPTWNRWSKARPPAALSTRMALPPRPPRVCPQQGPAR